MDDTDSDFSLDPADDYIIGNLDDASTNTSTSGSSTDWASLLGNLGKSAATVYSGVVSNNAATKAASAKAAATVSSNASTSKIVTYAVLGLVAVLLVILGISLFRGKKG